MAYCIRGKNYPVTFYANPRTSSSAIRKVLLKNGATQHGLHHSDLQEIDAHGKTLTVQTVRHHCDVLASYWYKAQRGIPFEYFVNTVLAGKNSYFRPEAFYAHWELAPNYVLRYETLDFEFSTLCGIAGLPDMKIPRTPSKRPKDVKWQDMFSTQLRDRVFERYQDEMELYGYGNN